MHQQVLILDINLSIFKQDLQLVFVFWHHQCSDMKWKQTLHFWTFLQQTVNEVTKDKHGLTTALVHHQLFQILLARQIQSESKRSSHTFVMTQDMSTEPSAFQCVFAKQGVNTWRVCSVGATGLTIFFVD